MAETFHEQPILNSPYEGPTRHHALEKDGQPTDNPPIASRRRSERISLFQDRRSNAAAQQPRGANGMVAFATEGATNACDAQAHVRAVLVVVIAGTMTDRELSQVQAAKICRTDQPTLSKVLRGRTDSVSVDKLLGWLLALGRPVELRISRYGSDNSATLTVAVDGQHSID